MCYFPPIDRSEIDTRALISSGYECVMTDRFVYHASTMAEVVNATPSTGDFHPGLGKPEVPLISKYITEQKRTWWDWLMGKKKAWKVSLVYGRARV